MSVIFTQISVNERIISYYTIDDELDISIYVENYPGDNFSLISFRSAISKCLFNMPPKNFPCL